MPIPRAIATFPAERLHPLSVGGRPAIEAFPQIAAHLRRARGPDHAALFAEPVPDRDRGVVDWYVTREGEVEPLDGLAAEASAAAEAELDRLVADIEAEAAALQASAAESDRLLGQAIAAALRVPDRSFVRVLDGKPVLVGWAHEENGRSIGPEALRRPIDRALDRMPILFPALADRAGWWRRFWLALGLLLTGLLFLLLFLLWWDPWRWFALPAPVCLPDPSGLIALEQRRLEEDRTLALRTDLARLARQVGEARLACPPMPPPATPARAEPPRPEPPQPNQDAERARREGAREGNTQIILAWDDVNDLDLAIVCPDGTRVYFENRRGCGAELDVDMNVAAGTRPISRSPVENVTWAAEPPPGNYRIEVTHYGRNPGGPQVSPFRVTIRRPGQPDRVLRGEAGAGQTVVVGTVRLP